MLKNGRDLQSANFVLLAKMLRHTDRRASGTLWLSKDESPAALDANAVHNELSRAQLGFYRRAKRIQDRRSLLRPSSRRGCRISGLESRQRQGAGKRKHDHAARLRST
jgi:hypothetical protein